MKHYIYIWLGVVLLLLNLSEARAKSISNPYGKPGISADSIMNKVFFFAPFYGSIVEDYHAKLYIKGQVDVKKKNRLIRYLPTMFRLQKGVNKYLLETQSDLHFAAPDVYEQRIKASMGTASSFWEADGRLQEYFHVNIYSSTLLYDKLLSPLAPNAKKFYKYYVDSVMGEAHKREYKIRFIPKSRSYQLVGGYLVVSDNVWSVREMRYTGRSEVFKFTNLLRMGDVGEPDEFLPVQSNVQGRFRLLGNIIEGSYVAALDYESIKQRNPGDALKTRAKDEYDLSESYLLSIDTNACQRDTAYFNKIRPIPLSREEQDIYASYSLPQDTGRIQKKKHVTWRQVEDLLIDYNTVSLNRLGSVRFSPLINPLMFGYSALNGISYSQELRYRRLFSGDRLLRITPSVGYNFKQNEFRWRVKSSFEYWPRERMSLNLDCGRGNRVYHSAMLDELSAIPDSVFNASQIGRDYYKDLYLIFRHSWEITNGLILDVNLTMHRRTNTKPTLVPVSSNSPSTTLIEMYPQSPTFGLDALNSLYRVYNSFAPGLRLTWTPGQYYYMDGDRKVNLHSKYPTISADWERGVVGVLPNSRSYERLEVDLQYDMSLGFMHNLYYRLGWGAFFKQQGVFFNDFSNFTRSNFPTGWNDDLGGVFQLLDRYWYNSSTHYTRGHITYESPFLLLRHFNKYTQYVLNERLYLSALYAPRLKPYVEIGYGIGTHIFDFGVFASFANWKYKEVGVKITFELFSR